MLQPIMDSADSGVSHSMDQSHRVLRREFVILSQVLQKMCGSLNTIRSPAERMALCHKMEQLVRSRPELAHLPAIAVLLTQLKDIQAELEASAEVFLKDQDQSEGSSARASSSVSLNPEEARAIYKQLKAQMASPLYIPAPPSKPGPPLQPQPQPPPPSKPCPLLQSQPQLPPSSKPDPPLQLQPQSSKPGSPLQLQPQQYQPLPPETASRPSPSQIPQPVCSSTHLGAFFLSPVLKPTAVFTSLHSSPFAGTWLAICTGGPGGGRCKRMNQHQPAPQQSKLPLQHQPQHSKSSLQHEPQKSKSSLQHQPQQTKPPLQHQLQSVHQPVSKPQSALLQQPPETVHELQQPPEPVLQLQQPSEPVLQLQQPSEPVLQLQQPLKPVLQLQQPLKPDLQLSSPHLSQASSCCSPHLRLTWLLSPNGQLSGPLGTTWQISLPSPVYSPARPGPLTLLVPTFHWSTHLLILVL